MILAGKMRTVSHEDPHFNDVLEAIKRGASEEGVLAILERELKRMTDAVNALAEKKITDDVTISGGLVLFRGEPVHNTLTDRMLKMLNEGFDLVPMARFLSNLMENPSHRAIQELYTFLEYGKMPITEDGCFYAYKAVNPDYTDIWTGTISNAIGAKPWMPRNKVDENPDRISSHGFHVCSFDYLPYFAHNNGHVMICKVNPRDVVAIPRDFSNTKMRVNTYEVVGEYEGYYSERRENVLTATTVAAEEKPFLVVIEGTDPSTQRYARLSEASEVAENALNEPSTERVLIINGVTNTVISTFENANFEGYDADDDADDTVDEDEEGEETLTYEVVYAQNADDLKESSKTYVSGIEDASEARRLALYLLDATIGTVVHVREEQTGNVVLTVSK